MANTNILELPAAIGLDGTEYFPVVQGGTTKKASTGLLLAIAAGGGVTESANTVYAGPTSGAAATPTFRALVSRDIPNALVLGVAGTSLGSVGLSGSASGVVTIQPQVAAGTYNFNLPTTAGTSGDVLISGGGVGAPMTWLAQNSLSINLNIGLTPIGSGADTRVLFQDGSLLAENSAFTFAKTTGLLSATALALNGATIGSNKLAVTGGVAGSAQIWSGSVSSALSTLTGGSDGFRNSAANVTQFAGENTTASSSTQGGFFGGYSNDGAALASGDRLGGIRMGGSSSASALRSAALIAGFAAENWVDASAYGSRLEFQTTVKTTTTLATKLILGDAGVLSFGATVANTVPALKPSSAILQARVGDDTAYCAFEALTFNKVTITAPASSATLTIDDGLTFRVSGGGTVPSGSAAYKAIGASGNTVPVLDGNQTFSGNNVFSGTDLTIGTTNTVFRAPSNNTNLFMDTTATNTYQSGFSLSDNGVTKYQFLKQVGPGFDFVMYDAVNAVTFFNYIPGAIGAGYINHPCTLDATGTGAGSASATFQGGVGIAKSLVAGGKAVLKNGTATPAASAAVAAWTAGSANVGFYWGTGDPGAGTPLSAAQGSLFIRTDGGANTRLYINNNGTTGWAAVTSA